jgi:signal transduction histidine kinase
LALAEAFPDLVFVVSAGRVAAVNAAGLRLLSAADAGEVVGRGVDEFIDLGVGLSVPRSPLESAGGARPVAWLPGHLRRCDGQVLDVEALEVPLPRDGNGYGLIVVRDVTANRRLLETARRIASESAKATGQLRQFLASMTHELRTPLNAIIGFSEIMASRVFGPLADRYAEYAKDILSSGRHLLEVVNDILDLSKIEAGELMLDEETVFTDEVADRCIRLVGERARIKSIRIAVDPSADLPPILADSTRMKQILLNLLSNAVKFTPEGGTVSVFSNRDTDGNLKITIVDTGIGMNQDQIIDALLPFRQIHVARRMQEQGTGLGLPIAKSLIELHGGTLTLESQPGRGTKAVILLPAERVISLR